MIYLCYSLYLYIPFSCLTQFCPLPHQNFETNAKYAAWILEPWIQDPKLLLLIFMVFKSLP